MAIIINLLTFYFVFLVSIIIHELGHYIVAKKRGLEVESFRVGTGPKLIEFTRKGTLFTLNLLPLSGANNFDANQFVTKDPIVLDFKQFKKKLRKEAFLSFAGPLSNLILAVFSFALTVGMLLVGLLHNEIQTGLFYRIADLFYLFAIANIVIFIINLIPFKNSDGKQIFKIIKATRGLNKVVKHYKKKSPVVSKNIQVKYSYSLLSENDKAVRMALEIGYSDDDFIVIV